LNVDEETVIDAAAVLCSKTRTYLPTAGDVCLLARDQIRTVAILILNDGKCEAAFVSAVLRAIAVGHKLLGVC
jgi:hypothetical protein